MRWSIARLFRLRLCRAVLGEPAAIAFLVIGQNGSALHAGVLRVF